MKKTFFVLKFIYFAGTLDKPLFYLEFKKPREYATIGKSNCSKCSAEK